MVRRRWPLLLVLLLLAGVTGCSATDRAQQVADEALPGQLQVLTATTKPGTLFLPQLDATYAVVDDPDAWVEVQLVRADRVVEATTAARWQAEEYRALFQAVAGAGLEPWAMGPSVRTDAEVRMSLFVRAEVTEAGLADLVGRLDRARADWTALRNERSVPADPRPRLTVHLVPENAEAAAPDPSVPTVRQSAITASTLSGQESHVIDPTDDASITRWIRPRLDDATRQELLATSESAARRLVSGPARFDTQLPGHLQEGSLRLLKVRRAVCRNESQPCGSARAEVHIEQVIDLRTRRVVDQRMID